ncbi:MAG: helix-turn-helix transcriptional regulator [Bacilli bacterium]|nr:helix-turn-helix transcriptional regulator [Bacilli bacterium]MDD7181387.1 helix-turn-helix transcriptional regulator [Bacilli bacterium]
MTLKQLRINKGLRQAKCADILQVSLRTYKRYESNESKINIVKYHYLIERLSEYEKIDLLDIEQLDNNPQLVNEILNDFITIYKR